MARSRDDHTEISPLNDLIHDEPTKYDKDVLGGPEVQGQSSTIAVTVTENGDHGLEGYGLVQFTEEEEEEEAAGEEEKAAGEEEVGEEERDREKNGDGYLDWEVLVGTVIMGRRILPRRRVPSRRVHPYKLPNTTAPESTGGEGAPLTTSNTSSPFTTSSQSGGSSNNTTEIQLTPTSKTTVQTESTSVPPPRSETSTPPTVSSSTVEHLYLYCRRRRARRIARIDAGLSTSSQKDRIMVSDRPWYKSPAYSFPRPWARSGYIPSKISSTSGSKSKTHKYTSSELSFSTITPSDSVSQAGHPSKVHKPQMKRKPLRTSTDLSDVPETREIRSPISVDGSSAIPGSEVLDRPKPVFPHPIPDIITTRATPQTSAVGR
ncbi:hypothetical protein PQX77_014985 [Marasmius sp. AFHP31]|nr:hypothetical protein PQX77_014985 [Marasmius sp. AFHP31]